MSIQSRHLYAAYKRIEAFVGKAGALVLATVWTTCEVNHGPEVNGIGPLGIQE
jgi:hypothetical protein